MAFCCLDVLGRGDPDGGRGRGAGDGGGDGDGDGAVDDAGGVDRPGLDLVVGGLLVLGCRGLPDGGGGGRGGSPEAVVAGEWRWLVEWGGKDMFFERGLYED